MNSSSSRVFQVISQIGLSLFSPTFRGSLQCGGTVSSFGNCGIRLFGCSSVLASAMKRNVMLARMGPGGPKLYANASKAKQVSLWNGSSSQEVTLWLHQKGLSKYKFLFRDVDGKSLLQMTREDIRIRLGAQTCGVRPIIDALFPPHKRTPKIRRLAKRPLLDSQGRPLLDENGDAMKRRGVALTRYRKGRLSSGN